MPQIGVIVSLLLVSVCPIWGSLAQAADGGSLYQISLESQQGESQSRDILNQISQLGGRPIGDKKILSRAGEFYKYDLLLSETNYGRLAEYLRTLGALKVIRRNEPSGAAVGQVRIELTVVFKGKSGPEMGESFQRPDKLSVPLQLDLTRNGTEVSGARWIYKIEGPAGFDFNGDSLKFSDFQLLASTADQVNFVMRFEWPSEFLKVPQITLVSDQGEEIEKFQPEPLEIFEILSAEDLASGKKAPRTADTDPSAAASKLTGRVFYQTKLVSGGSLDTLQSSKFFRVCWRVQRFNELLEFCSQPLQWSAKDLKNLVKAATDKSESGAFIDGKKVALAGSLDFKDVRKPRSLELRFPGGAKLKGKGQLPQVEVRDVVGAADGKTVIVSGSGLVPEGATSKGEESWSQGVTGSYAILKVRSETQVPYAIEVKMERPPPSERDRPYLWDTGREAGTYLDSVEISGAVAKGLEVSAGADAVKQKGNAFRWKFNLGARGYDHRNYITVKKGDKTFLAYHQMHRGFPFEVSARLTGVLSSFQSLLFLGEVAGGAWAENLFGWRHKYLSDQRWGLGGNYFQSLSASQLPLTALTGNLKYRLTRGLWNKDETWGLIAGFTDVTYRGVNARLGGVGFLWARTMPRIFDDLFNLIPIFRFPKWVDMEGIYYPLSLSPSASSQGTFSLTFHGKMFFLPEFFMEAGFGLKRYAFSSSTAQKDLATTMVFGTGGFGYNF